MKLTMQKLETMIWKELQPRFEVKIKILNQRSPEKLRRAFTKDDGTIFPTVTVYVPETDCAYVFFEDLMIQAEKHHEKHKKYPSATQVIHGINRSMVSENRHRKQFLWLKEKYGDDAVKMYYHFYEVFDDIEDNPLEMDADAAAENIYHDGHKEPDVGPIMEKAIDYLKWKEEQNKEQIE